MLAGVRPNASRRSWWLREALAAEGSTGPPGDAADGAPPLRGTTTADVVVLGGGYTGLWTALRVRELAPDARVVLVEADICGGGPSGRNGGFVTSWWDDLPTLIERYGDAGALETGRAMEAAVDEIGRWCAANGVDAWYTKAGTMSVSAAPAQDGRWQDAVEAAARLGVGDRYVALTPAEIADRVISPVMRAGAFMPGAATVQPALLARGLRRVALDRGVVIHEGTRVSELDGERPGWLGSLGAGRRRAGPRRLERDGQDGPARGGRRGADRPVRIRTTSSVGDGEVIAGSAVVAMNAWAAAWPSFGRRLVTWSSYIVLTEPVGDRLAEIGWTGGEGIADARFTLHYLRTTRDGRIAIGGGGGGAGFGGRIGATFTDDAVAASRAAAGLRRLFPSLRDVRIEDAWGGPIDIAADHLPTIGSLPGRPIHFAHGYSGNGVGPSVVAGRLLAGLAVGPMGVVAPTDDPLAPPVLLGGHAKAFPPEPIRYAGARVIREAIVRREAAEERGEPVPWWLRELTRVPRRLGFHLSPD